MKTLFPFLALAVTALSGLWLSQPPKPEPLVESIPWTPQLSRAQETGRRIYLRRCGWCHGEQRDGFGLNATRLETPPTDFTAAQYRHPGAKAAVIEWLEGRRPRPAPLCPDWQATLAPAEMNAVADYLLTP